MVHCGTPWCTVVLHGTLWYPVVYCFDQQNITALFAVFLGDKHQYLIKLQLDLWHPVNKHQIIMKCDGMTSFMEFMCYRKWTGKINWPSNFNLPQVDTLGPSYNRDKLQAMGRECWLEITIKETAQQLNGRLMEQTFKPRSQINK